MKKYWWLKNVYTIKNFCIKQTFHKTIRESRYIYAKNYNDTDLRLIPYHGHRQVALLTSPSSSCILLLNSLPSKTRKSEFGLMMPHFVAMERAVLMLSPVTMRTQIPARWHFLIDSGTCSAIMAEIGRISMNATKTFVIFPPRIGA